MILVTRRIYHLRATGPAWLSCWPTCVTDTVAVWKLDRRGRNMLHILQTVKELTEHGVTLVSVTDGTDSSTPAGRMMIGVLGSLAEYERELIKERTALTRAA